MPASAAKVLNLSSEVGTWGSTGDVKYKLHGVTDASLQIVSKTEAPAQIGWFGQGPLADRVAQSGEGSMELVATYQEMPKIFNGFFSLISASTITSGAPYTYPYTAPTQSTQTVGTFTAEFGTSGAAYRANGVIFTDLTLKGEAGGFWTASVPFLAKEILPATSGMSTAMVDRSVTPIKMSDTNLYIDAFSTGTMGATVVSNTLISFELAYKTGRHTKQFAGSISPADWGEGKHEVSLKLTAEFNASAKAIVDEMLGSTGVAINKQISIRATEGSSNSVKSAYLNVAGFKSEGEKLFEDRDGNMTVAFTFTGKYSTGLGNTFTASVQNGSSGTTGL